MSELFKDIPEFVEVHIPQCGQGGSTDVQTSIGESVTARTETLGMSMSPRLLANLGKDMMSELVLKNSVVPRTRST
jgi:hypothetical protein